MLVPVAEMVLPELTRRISLRLQDIGDGRHPVGDAVRISRHPDRQKAGAEGLHPEDERGAAGGAALLAIAVGEDCAFACDAVDVRRAIAHEAHRVGADLRNADVIAEYHEDVGRLAGGGRLRLSRSALRDLQRAHRHRRRGCNRGSGQKRATTELGRTAGEFF